MGMDPVSQDLVITRGITHDPIVVVFKNNGNQVDLTGWSVFSQARTRPGGPIVLDLRPVFVPVGVLLGYDGEVDGPGRVKLGDFTDEETFAMKNANLLWDIVLQTPDGRRLGPYVAGKCDIVTIISEPV